jgi:hypothetical protein
MRLHVCKTSLINTTRRSRVCVGAQTTCLPIHRGRFMRGYHRLQRARSANGLRRTLHPSKGRGAIGRRSNSRCCQSRVSIDACRHAISYVRQGRRGRTGAMATAKRSTGPSPNTTPDAHAKDIIVTSKNLVERPLSSLEKVKVGVHVNEEAWSRLASFRIERSVRYKA